MSGLLGLISMSNVYGHKCLSRQIYFQYQERLGFRELFGVRPNISVSWLFEKRTFEANLHLYYNQTTFFIFGQWVSQSVIVSYLRALRAFWLTNSWPVMIMGLFWCGRSCGRYLILFRHCSTFTRRRLWNKFFSLSARWEQVPVQVDIIQPSRIS